MNNKTENNTINASELVFNFIQQVELVDTHELARFEAQEKSVGFLKLLRNQYNTIQHGNAIQLKAGELPHTIALEAVTRLWDSKDRSGAFVNFKEYQMKQLKYYIETGEIYTRKREVLQERAMIAIDKLEKKLTAEKAKLDKAKQAADKATEVKAKAETKAAQVNAESEQVIEEICTIIDDDPQGASAVQSELLGVIDDAQAAQAAADAHAAQAAADKAAADKAAADAQTAADKTKKELDKVKAKLANLSAPKAENNKSDPKLDFKTTNFSQDCKDTASMLLTELEREASAAELLYLAKLILDKYNK